MRIAADTSRAFRWKVAEFSNEGSGFVEELFRTIASHPMLNELEMLRVRYWIKNGHLMRSPGALKLVSVDLLRTPPTLGRTQNDHRPPWPFGRCSSRCTARLLLNGTNLENAPLHDLRHLWVHQRWVVALY